MGRHGCQERRCNDPKKNGQMDARHRPSRSGTTDHRSVAEGWRSDQHRVRIAPSIKRAGTAQTAPPRHQEVSPDAYE
jgi:hypothetical protein